MRKYGRTDANQKEIMAALRAIGATVQDLSPIGGGCPDALVGFRNRTILCEWKDGAKPPSARKLTPAQVAWHKMWNGDRVYVVSTIEEALAAIGAV